MATSSWRPARSLVAAFCFLSWCASSAAFQVGIQPASRTLYLQVGAGSFTDTYEDDGTFLDNSTINRVSVTVTPAQLGTGAVLGMTSNSTVTRSPYDNRIFCATPSQVYVGGFFRRTGGGQSTAVLSVSTTASLVSSAADTIPFTEISWISGGIGDGTPTIPSGSFTGGSQTLLTVDRNTWFESCLQFRYGNSQLYPAGTFSGRATYTLSSP